MTALRPTLAVLLAALALPAAAAAQVTPEQLEREGLRDIIVIRESGLDAAERTELRAHADVDHVRMLRLDDTEVVRAGPGALTEALDALNADPAVVLAEPDAPVYLTTTNDPHWATLWGLHNTGQTILGHAGVADADIDAPEAWATSTGTGSAVGIVDTGVQLDHPDLAARIAGNPGEVGANAANGIDDDGNGKVDDWRGWNFVNDNNLPQDVNGHGTHVAGTVAAVRGNGVGVAGVAPDAGVVPLKALSDDGSGYSSDVAEAFDYAGKIGLKVVNASLGSDFPSTVISNAISANPGTLYVVAAGNDGRNVETTPTYPCRSTHANIVCVGASTSSDAVADFSNVGTTSVDLFAPGTLIRSAYPTSTYAYLQGTSMATPHVAGAAALLHARNASLTAADLKSALLTSVDAKAGLSGNAVTGGRLNAASALALVSAGPAPQWPLASILPSPNPGSGPTPDEPAPAPQPQPVPAWPGDEDGVDEGEDEVDEPQPGPALRLQRKGSTSLCRSGCATRAFELRFTLPRSAPVRTTYERRVCKGRGCTWVAVIRRTVAGRSGTNTLKVSTKVGSRRLGRGRYRLTLSVAADGGRSTSRVAFTVR